MAEANEYAFTRETIIADALKARPELRDMLPAFHPAFEKLRHPLLGRVLPRLVNVDDAARVAGVDPEALLAVINLPGPPPAAHRIAPVERTDEPEPAWLRGASARLLDARPLLERGEEPFAAVMSAARALGPGEVLTVLAPFEPAPLRRLLGGQGWRHHAAWDGEICRTSFWYPPERRPRAEGPGGFDLDALLKQGPEGLTLDVRSLEPPLPLRAVLAALERPDAPPLLMIHRREPALLYPKLDEQGLAHTTRQREDGAFEIRIHEA